MDVMEAAAGSRAANRTNRTTYLHRRSSDGPSGPSIHRRRPGGPCSHCGGSGHEPQPFDDRSLERGSVTRIAKQAGLDKSSVSRMLAGQSVPSLATIILAANALGISESRLIHCPPVWHRLMQEISADGGD